MSRLTAVIALDRSDPARLFQMYVDGQHIGYAKINNAYATVMVKMLETSRAVLVNTTSDVHDD